MDLWEHFKIKIKERINYIQQSNYKTQDKQRTKFD